MLSRRVGLILASTVAAGSLAVTAAPAASAEASVSAASAETCYNGSVADRISVKQKRTPTNPKASPRGGASYSAYWRWCATGGEVVSFVVGSVRVDPGATLDIRPHNALVWGPEYPIFVHVVDDKGNYSNHEITLKADGSSPRSHSRG